MQQQPTFSVLVPSYNAGPFIEATMRSALEQLGPDDEIVVQDGGSTDGTVLILEAFATEDPRVSVVSEKDSGQSDALNRALARAQKSHVIWLNADDLLLEGSLDALRRTLEEDTGLDLAWGGHRYIRADGSPIEDFLPDRFDHALFMRRGCYVFSGSVAVRVSVLRSLGGFSRDLHYCMDLELMLALDDLLDPARVTRVARPIGALRWHDASKSGTTATPFLREGWQVRGRHMQGGKDQIRRAEALAVLGLAHATVGLRHSPAYRRIRKVLISPLSSVKTSAPLDKARG